MRLPALNRMAIAALVLGVTSPFVACIGIFEGDPTTLQSVLHTWFFAAPIAVDQFFWFASDHAMLALAIHVYIVQYLVALVGLRTTYNMFSIGRDFLSPHRPGF